MASGGIVEEESRSVGSVDEEEGDSWAASGSHPTRDNLADGLLSLLSPTLHSLDEGVAATKKSQEDLSEQIALLTEQLQSIAVEQSCPIDLNGYVARLGDIKGKINVISSVLHSAQDRLTKVHEQAIKEATRRKPIDSSSLTLGSSKNNSEINEDLQLNFPSSSQTKESPKLDPQNHPLS